MRRNTQAIKGSSLLSGALFAALAGAPLAAARDGSPDNRPVPGSLSHVEAAFEAPAETLLGGDVLSWNLTLVGLVGAPFNLGPSNSVVYLSGSRVDATGRDVTFHYSGGDEGDGESGTGPFDGNRDCNPGEGPCVQADASPHSVFEAQNAAGVRVFAPALPGAPEPAIWTLILRGFGTIALVRVWRRKTLASRRPTRGAAPSS